jgi:hypothetical protein
MGQYSFGRSFIYRHLVVMFLQMVTICLLTMAIILNSSLTPINTNNVKRFIYAFYC